jgi:hypothetical protein
MKLLWMANFHNFRSFCCHEFPLSFLFFSLLFILNFLCLWMIRINEQMHCSASQRPLFCILVIMYKYILDLHFHRLFKYGFQSTKSIEVSYHEICMCTGNYHEQESKIFLNKITWVPQRINSILHVSH